MNRKTLLNIIYWLLVVFITMDWTFKAYATRGYFAIGGEYGLLYISPFLKMYIDNLMIKKRKKKAGKNGLRQMARR